MFKPLIAGLTALSLTFAFATPTYANGLDREEVGKILIGLAAIVALNAAIKNNNRRDEMTAPAVTPVQRGIHRDNDWAALSRQHGSNDRRTVPSACLQTVDTRFATQRLYGQHCLERNYRHVNSLPERCAVRFYTSAGPVRGFDPLCLQEHGYRSDRRN